MTKRCHSALAILLPVLLICGVSFAQTTPPTVTVRPLASAQPGVLLLIDGKAIEAESLQMVRGQQAMVWLRDVEKLGWGTVEAGQPHHVVFKSKNGVVLTFVKGESLAMVNSLSVQLPVKTFLREGRFMVPLSFVAKSLGYKYQCDYKPVCIVETSPAKTVTAGANAVHGRIVHSGKAAAAVKVRVVDKDYVTVRGALSLTDKDGRYKIEGLPDGDYRVYVHDNDNPSYSNAASALISLAGGRTVEAPPVSLTRTLSPVSPKAGGIATVKTGKVSFSWTPCDGAVTYKLVVIRRDNGRTVAEASSGKPAVQVAAARFADKVLYEVRVSAFNAAGERIGGTSATGGAPWTFTVGLFPDASSA